MTSSLRPINAEDLVTVPVDVPRYFLTQIHLARCWGRQAVFEFAWFMQSLRNELPEHKKKKRDWEVVHIFLPRSRYLLALEALTTRLGTR